MKRLKARWLIAVCFAAVLVTHARSDEDAALAEALRQIEARVAEIDDLTAEFEQRKHTALLREPMISRGTVRVRGNQMRWDTRTPDASAMLMDGSALQIHYPDHGLLEIYPLNERLGQLAASPLTRPSALREHFIIAPDAARAELKTPHLPLRLTPRNEQLAEHVREVRIAIDSERGFLLRMEMVDGDDERIEMVFTDHRINTGLTKRDLELVVPEGTRIVRPLKDLPAEADGADAGDGSAGE